MVAKPNFPTVATLHLEDGAETQVPLLPVTLDGVRLQPRMALAGIGEHTAQVLAAAGCGAADVA